MIIHTKSFGLTVVFLLSLGGFGYLGATAETPVFHPVPDNTLASQNENAPSLNQINESIPGGATILISDLRANDRYADSSHNKERKRIVDESSDLAFQNKSVDSTPGAELIDEYEQRMTQLEQDADNSANDLHKLNQKIDTLAAQIANIQTAVQAINIHSIIESVAVKSSDTNIITDLSRQPEPESDAPLAVAVLNNIQSDDIATEYFADIDLLLMVGLSLTLLITIVLLNVYRKSKSRRKSRRDEYDVAVIEPIDRHRFQGLFNRKSKSSGIQPSDNVVARTSKMAAQASRMIEQGASKELAIQFLQKQLAVDRLDVYGWLQLFELLYQVGDKADFKKNARRFKRLNEFPDIWAQIQTLGNRLEPNESLYFDDQKRQEKFFSDKPTFE
ncbi:hypothetical protein W03_21960 [Nitrosomonas sp. PY1]|uniref:hypothetical protein n=1 Tax=Nitrosomonas sp. PY1 TaxID=1803906 RepID=UPI001FC8BF4A|nr:hypothetical protein [Nitrosomonas sp. PY1]GKS70192.1 hypothetical protein W03_21960 [Nitrosomonas sp. PY1]